MATCAPQASLFRSKPVTRKMRLNLTDILLGITFVWSMVPATLIEDIYIYDIPLRFGFFYASVVSCLISTLVYGASKVTPYMKVVLVTTLFMAVLGLLRGNDLRYWVIDASNATGLLLGLYWARRYSLQRTLNTLYCWSIAICLILFLNIVGLMLGIIPQANEGERLYSFSLFISTAFVTCLFPLWFVVDTKNKTQGLPPRIQMLAVACISCVLFASILSATRSMFVTGTLAILLVLWLRLHGKNALSWIFATLAACLFIGIFAFSTNGWLSARSTTRLTSTEISEEYRYIELLMMFEDLEGSFLTGKGFGSRFESCIGKRGEFLAFAPHVAIFTSLFKGGVASFFLLIVLPLGLAIYHLLRLNGGIMCLSFSAAVVLYCAQASMSGGWNFIALFLYGATFTLASRCMIRKRRSPLLRRS